MGVHYYTRLPLAHVSPNSVVLVDLSMPILDGECPYPQFTMWTHQDHPLGIGATARMRDLESTRKLASDKDHATRTARILALTGMSSLEDKRKAFEAGVDG